MRIKMGTSVPKVGTTVHLDADQTAYSKAIADALGLSHDHQVLLSQTVGYPKEAP